MITNLYQTVIVGDLNYAIKNLACLEFSIVSSVPPTLCDIKEGRNNNNNIENVMAYKRNAIIFHILRRYVPN